MFSGDFVKNAATSFLLVVALGGVGIYGWDLVNNIPVPAIINTLVTSAVLVALGLAGLNHGITVANGVAGETARKTVEGLNAGQNETNGKQA